ncbi:MAG: tetratricopeptide repeat protein [Syntrophobacteraceae bacterium]
MKRFHLPFSIVVSLILAVSGPVIAGSEANDATEYTFHPCAIDSKQSSRLIANEHVKRKLAKDLAEKLEREERLLAPGLTKTGATDLMTSVVRLDTTGERWDGTGYTVTARAAGGRDGILESLQLVRKDRHVEKDLIQASRRASTVLQQIDDFSRGHRESVPERLEIDRYHTLLDELEAINGYTRGLVLLVGGRFNEAAQVLTESIQRDSDGARLHHYRGVTHARMGHQAEALIDYERAIELDCNFASPHLGRAEILFAQGHRDNALADLRSAVAIDPNFTEAHFLMGVVYGDMGNNKRAIDSFTAAIALDTDLAMAYAHRGDTYGKMGYHKLAFKDFNRAISLDGSLWIVHLHSGVLHERRRSYARAHDEYSRVIKLNDRCAVAHAYRGRVRAKLGVQEMALEDFDRAIALDPKLAVAYFNRGLTHMKLGHVERALDDQRMAARLEWKAARDFLSAKGIRW